jgi:hypothetical protein
MRTQATQTDVNKQQQQLQQQQQQAKLLQLQSLLNHQVKMEKDKAGSSPLRRDFFHPKRRRFCFYFQKEVLEIAASLRTSNRMRRMSPSSQREEKKALKTRLLHRPFTISLLPSLSLFSPLSLSFLSFLSFLSSGETRLSPQDIPSYMRRMKAAADSPRSLEKIRLKAPCPPFLSLLRFPSPAHISPSSAVVMNV